ncbi:MAG TPA: hypothetical protein VD994_12575 [Prosthecobacter sp.]|nr:hypothetical protein [Prosthecobacter sp.]
MADFDRDDAGEEAARFITRSEGYFELGDSREGLRVLDSMPQELQGFTKVKILRALLLMSLELWPEAEAVAATALAAPEMSSVLWYSLAVAQAQQMKLEEARESLRWAIDLDADLREVALRDVALVGVW